jgi:hypothetical protein
LVRPAAASRGSSAIHMLPASRAFFGATSALKSPLLTHPLPHQLCQFLRRLSSSSRIGQLQHQLRLGMLELCDECKVKSCEDETRAMHSANMRLQSALLPTKSQRQRCNAWGSKLI